MSAADAARYRVLADTERTAAHFPPDGFSPGWLTTDSVPHIYVPIIVCLACGCIVALPAHHLKSCAAKP